jgi:hypothetical protein
MVYPSVPECVVATTTGAPCKETPTETKQEKPALPPEYEKYCAAFSEGLEKLPKHGPQDLEIKLKEGKLPPMGPMYSMSEKELDIVHTYVTNMLQKGLIQPSKLPSASSKSLLDNE